MWQTPKTDWTAKDFFNVQDYNRIKGNLNAIKDKAFPLWGAFVFEDMGADKSYQDYSFYADEINRFEGNIERICAATYPFPVGERKTYRDNEPFIDWRELNRIEMACQLIYSNVLGRESGRKRLAFRLKGGAF